MNNCYWLMILLAITGTVLAEPVGTDQRALSAMDFFVGSCWQGTFQDGKTTDTHCFRTMYDGRFIRDNHIVEGKGTPYAGETIYVWNAEAKHIEYTYYDSNGGISRGVMMPTENGLRSPAEVYTAADGSERMISSVWTITGEHSWTQSAEETSGDETKALWRVEYTRTPMAEGPKP